MAFVLMASVWAKNNLTALSVALISVVAPLIVYMVSEKFRSIFRKCLICILLRMKEQKKKE